MSEPWAASASTADLRALAATRIGVALLLLYDLLTRLGDFSAHYTEAGVLPRALVPTDPLYGNGLLSLHLLTTSSLAQGLLFAAALIAALALLVGHHTRRATWVSWWLLISLQARNPHVLYEADVMLGLLLLWGGLLPWGRRWSLDNAGGLSEAPSPSRQSRSGSPPRGRRRSAPGKPAPPTRYRSAAVLGIRLQMSTALLVALASKTGDTWWDGTAVGYVLKTDVYANDLGRWLGGFEALIPLFTWGTLVVELVGPLLVFARGRLRWVGIALLAGLQLGFLTTLQLGIFPATFLVALLPFVPTRAERVVRERRPRPAGGEPEPFTCESEEASQRPPECRRWVGIAAWALILLSAAHNLAYLANERELSWAPDLRAGPLAWTARTLHVDQGWGMFAPDPMTGDCWVVLPAQTADGRELDLLQGAPLDWDKPDSVAGSYGGDRWKELLMAVTEDSEPEVWQRLLTHFARLWEAAHPQAEVQAARLVLVTELTQPGGEAEPSYATLAFWDTE